MVFASEEDVLNVRLRKISNLSERKGLEEVSSGLAIGYDYTLVSFLYKYLTVNR